MSVQNKPSSGNNRSQVALTLDRRGFLTVGATLGAGLLLPDVTGCSSVDDDNPIANGELFTPASVRSRDGVLDIELTITEIEATVGQYTFMTRAYTGLEVHHGTSSFGDTTYTGAIPGPTIELRPGDRLKLKLINRLPDDNSAVDPRLRHGQRRRRRARRWARCGHAQQYDQSPHARFARRPRPPGDDVFLAIGPGESYDFVFDIPRDIEMPDGTTVNHPAGTYWYHPHMHGSTAIQVAGGMAGAIIIRDEERTTSTSCSLPSPGRGRARSSSSSSASS
ncbi:multicopper oxidase domain-containing protein [Nannocystis pusilla]|uniref:multicopper oxidase domain-containing protein n=1 Tax=Nannocystis pusilla TaxID=889268 RepID=UPI003B7C74D1